MIRKYSFILRYQAGRNWLLPFCHVCEEKVDFYFSVLHREISTRAGQDPAKTSKTSTHIFSQTHSWGILASWFLWVLIMVKLQYSLAPFPFCCCCWMHKTSFYVTAAGHSRHIALITHRYRTQGEFLTTTSYAGDMLLILMESKGPCWMLQFTK